MSAAHTPGPLTVRVSERWPYDIETVNAEGAVVFLDGMPAHSSAMKNLEDLWDGVGFRGVEREEIVAANHRAVADAVIRSAAPDLLEAALNMKGLYDTPAERRCRSDDPFYAEAIEVLRAAIRKATTAVEPNSVGTPKGVNQK